MLYSQMILYVLYCLLAVNLNLLFKGVDYTLLFSNIYDVMSFTDLYSVRNTPQLPPQLPDYYLNSRRFGFTKFIFHDLNPMGIKYCGVLLDRQYYPDITILVERSEFRGLVSGRGAEDLLTPCRNIPFGDSHITGGDHRYYALSGRMRLLPSIAKF